MGSNPKPGLHNTNPQEGGDQPVCTPRAPERWEQGIIEPEAEGWMQNGVDFKLVF